MTTKTRKTTKPSKKAAKSAPDSDAYERDLAELLSGKEYVLIGQRTCRADGDPHSQFADDDFRWPMRGWVEAPDWSPINACGRGLHYCAVGAVGGEVVRDSGSTIILESSDLRWQVVIARAADSVRIDDEKHKARRVFVVDLDGSREAVTAWLDAHGIVGHHITLTGGDGSTLTGGDGSTLTGGDGSTLTGGDGSTLTGGDGSTLTGGDGSTLTGGDGSTLTGGDGSTLTGGDGSTLTGGDGSTLHSKNNSRIKTAGNAIVVTTWFDGRGQQQVKAWTVGDKRDLKADTLYEIVNGVATEIK